VARGMDATAGGLGRPWHLTCFLSWLRVTRAGQGLDGAGAARLGDAEAAAVATPAAAMVASTEDDPLPKDPVDNAQQFFGWFAAVEASMERGREDVYRYVFDPRSALADVTAPAVDTTFSAAFRVATSAGRTWRI